MDKSRRVKKEFILFSLFALLALGGYFFWSSQVYRIGYPLDDAWIHQTYARNFAQTGQWVYSPGQTSGGSTGPIWGFLLAVLHLVRLPEIAGTAVLGWFLLIWTTVFTLNLVLEFKPDLKIHRIFIGGIVIFEWHLVWSAGSGMETLLFSLIAISVIYLTGKPDRSVFLIGFLAGLSVWVRPGGLTLIGPVLFVMVFSDLDQKIKNISYAITGFLTPIIPYFLFNYFVVGDFWPNTFFAKQAEYAELLKLPFFNRFWTVFNQLLVGVGILLFPGLIEKVRIAVKSKNWQVLGAACWLFGYLGIYVLKLPVDYQHGRYVIPVVPIYLGLGLAGSAEIFSWNSEIAWRRILGRLFWTSVAAVSLVFWIKGADAYARDVAVIEAEMVETALWINQNLEENAVIAAHDIGALGYFGNREIIDLAGLITPDVIPIIRNEAALSAYLDLKKADYLMTFPDWYQQLNDGLPIVYRSKGKFAPQFGAENMTIYSWQLKGE